MTNNIFYYPCLMLKAAELKAVDRLPSVSKDKIFPCVLLRPWLTAKDLKRGLNKFESAFPDRGYFLDIDYDYAFGREAALHPDFEPMVRGGFIMKTYFNFIAEFPRAIPLLRFREEFDSFANLDRQFERIDQMGRGLGIRFHERIVKGSALRLLQEIMPRLLEREATIFLDVGWLSDSRKGYRLFQPLLEHIAEAVSGGGGDKLKVILSGSSFPKSFSDINDVEFVANKNLILFKQAVSEFGNKLDLRYGDWGSARPADRGFAVVIPARIDYPIDGGWYIARNPDVWDYPMAAQKIIDSSAWLNDLELWGANLIAATAKTVAGHERIEGAKDNVRARLNIHLHTYANIQNPNQKFETDDPWPEEL